MLRSTDLHLPSDASSLVFIVLNLRWFFLFCSLFALITCGIYLTKKQKNNNFVLFCGTYLKKKLCIVLPLYNPLKSHTCFNKGPIPSLCRSCSSLLYAAHIILHFHRYLICSCIKSPFEISLVWWLKPVLKLKHKVCEQILRWNLILFFCCCGFFLPVH